MMDCISFIDGGAANGVGFFVGDLFITAGHVIEHGQKFIIYCGEKIELSKSAAIYLNCAGGGHISPEVSDLAVFAYRGADSPLVFAENPPALGQHLQVVSKRRVVKHVGAGGLPPIFCSEEFIETYTCNGKLTSHCAGYWEMQMDKPLCEGDSGSPFMDGKQVYGVLVGGEPGTSRCVFLSSVNVLEIIKALR